MIHFTLLRGLGPACFSTVRTMPAIEHSRKIQFPNYIRKDLDSYRSGDNTE